MNVQQLVERDGVIGNVLRVGRLPDGREICDVKWNGDPEVESVEAKKLTVYTGEKKEEKPIGSIELNADGD